MKALPDPDSCCLLPPLSMELPQTSLGFRRRVAFLHALWSAVPGTWLVPSSGGVDAQAGWGTRASLGFCGNNWFPPPLGPAH